jgi:hypothetical protein
MLRCATLVPGWLLRGQTSSNPKRGLMMTCHHPRKRVIQYSRDGGDELRSRGVLDAPLSRGMTTRN